MAVRTFTAPSSVLNGVIAMTHKMEQPRSDGAIDEGRSLEKASETTMSMKEESRDPLASHHPAKSKPGITFAAQDSLPKLPIPDLEDTCKRYLEALEPLQTYREQRDTERAVREFQRHEGPELQAKLKEYATGKSSYIEQFCMSNGLILSY